MVRCLCPRFYGFFFFTICQALGLMMALVVITRFKEQCWNLLISLMGLIHEETSRFLWQQIGKYREFRQPRFWVRRVNWHWTFWTLQLWFWKTSWVMTLSNTNFVALRHIKREQGSVPVDFCRSKKSLTCHVMTFIPKCHFFIKYF